MSEKTLKRYLKHREKKERGQLQSRKHLGMLEKNKDYKLRAADYRNKRDQIRKLQEKALQRNPDEFSHRMEQHVVNSDGNVIGLQQKQRQRKHMMIHKEKDHLYLQSKINKTRKQLDHERHSLAAIEEFDNHKTRQHTIFVDNDEDVDNFDAAEHFNTLPELVDRAHNRLTKEQLAEETLFVNKPTPGLLKAAEKAKTVAYEKLSKEEAALRAMERHHKKIVLQRKLMKGGRVQKIVKKDKFGDEIKSKTNYKWRAERKRWKSPPRCHHIVAPIHSFSIFSFLVSHTPTPRGAVLQRPPRNT